jgi:hypothetical protein
MWSGCAVSGAGVFSFSRERKKAAIALAKV